MKKLLSIIAFTLAFPAYATDIKPVIIPTPTIVRTVSAIDKLPPEKAALFKKAEEEQKAKTAEINLKINIKRKEMQKILLTEPFNKELYLTKSSELINLEHEKIDARTTAITDLASKFTVEERKILVGAFEKFSKIIQDKNP